MDMPDKSDCNETPNGGLDSPVPWDHLLVDSKNRAVVAPSSDSPNTDSQSRSSKGLLDNYQKSYKISVGGKENQRVFSRYKIFIFLINYTQMFVSTEFKVVEFRAFLYIFIEYV